MLWGPRGKPAPPAGGEVSSLQVVWSCLLDPSEHLGIGHKGDTKNCPAAHIRVWEGEGRSRPLEEECKKSARMPRVPPSALAPDPVFQPTVPTASWRTQHAL